MKQYKIEISEDIIGETVGQYCFYSQVIYLNSLERTEIVKRKGKLTFRETDIFSHEFAHFVDTVLVYCGYET